MIAISMRKYDARVEQHMKDAADLFGDNLKEDTV